MGQNANTTTRVSSFVLMIILVTVALSLVALILAISAYSAEQQYVAGYLLIMGAIGIALSAYVLLQVRKRAARIRIETPTITTTIECKKCGFKSTRDFQRGDYVFKKVEPCQKCSDMMTITAIYKEVKEKEKGAFPF
jgi:Na+/melibiose symporter-like transporter